MDTPEDVLNIHDSSILLAFVEEPKESEECEDDASVYDHKHDEWYGHNVDGEECIVEETILEKSHEVIEHEVPYPCLQLVEYISPNPLNLNPASLTCLPLPPSPTDTFLRPLPSFVINDINVDSGLIDNFFP